MAKHVFITVDAEQLSVHLKFEEQSDKILNDLKLLVSGLTDEWHYKDQLFIFPWFEFRRNFNSVISILKRQGFKIVLDEKSTSLINDILTERRNLKNKDSEINLQVDSIQDELNKVGFRRNLKDEQIRDVKKLITLKHGANFSVPGAGKTTTILAVHSLLKSYGVVDKLFVIAPINAFISWEDEIQEIFGSLKTCRINREHLSELHLSKDADAHVHIVNYEKVRRDISGLIPYFFLHKVHLVLDESHRVKGGLNNISYNQIIKLADIAKRRDILSGTPMPQSCYDLIPQFDFLWPGQKIIESKINSNDEANIQIEKTNSAIQGLFARTTKNELGLKDPEIVYTKVKMGSIQSELYQLFKSEAARIAAGLDRRSKSDFRRIGRSVVKLLQAATNPMLLGSKDEYFEDLENAPLNKEFWELLDEFSKYEKSVKIEYLKKRVSELVLCGKKVLIWSYFVRNIKILERIFSSHNPVTIYGGVPSGSSNDEMTREGRIRKFHNDSSCMVMIANPQACGEGISLHTVCHNAIYLDRNFNSAFFLQSIDRIHRLGLGPEIDTEIEILISENTIDEILIDRLNEKIDAMGKVLEDPYLQSLAYDPEDISIDDEFGIDSKDYDTILRHVNDGNS